MNHSQAILPEYWVVHNPKENDVLIDTASKSLSASESLALFNHGIDVGDDSNDYTTSLISLTLNWQD